MTLHPTSNSLAGVTSNGFTHSFRFSTRLQSSCIFRNILTWANVCFFFGTVKQHPHPMVSTGPFRFATFCWWVGFVGLSLRSLTEQLGKKGDESHGHIVEIENIPGGDGCRSGENHGPTFSRGKILPLLGSVLQGTRMKFQSHTKRKPSNSSKHFRQWSSCFIQGNTSCVSTSSRFFWGNTSPPYQDLNLSSPTAAGPKSGTQPASTWKNVQKPLLRAHPTSNCQGTNVSSHTLFPGVRCHPLSCCWSTNFLLGGRVLNSNIWPLLMSNMQESIYRVHILNYTSMKSLPTITILISNLVDWDSSMTCHWWLIGNKLVNRNSWRGTATSYIKLKLKLSLIAKPQTSNPSTFFSFSAWPWPPKILFLHTELHQRHSWKTRRSNLPQTPKIHGKCRQRSTTIYDCQTWQMQYSATNIQTEYTTQYTTLKRFKWWKM